MQFYWNMSGVYIYGGAVNTFGCKHSNNGMTQVGSDYDDYSGDVYYLNYMSNSADPEINAMYSSSGKSSLWSDAKSFRIFCLVPERISLAPICFIFFAIDIPIPSVAPVISATLFVKSNI